MVNAPNQPQYFQQQQEMQMQEQQVQQVQEQQLVRQSDNRVTRWDNVKVQGQPTLSHEHDAGYFTAHNVEGGIHVLAPNLDFKVLKSKNTPGQYRIQYKPDGEEHVVDVQDEQMQSVLGAPFKIAPRVATLDHDTKNGRIVLSNIYNENDVDVQTDSCPFNMSPMGKNKYAIELFPHYNGGEHTISVSHKGKVMPGGKFKMLPNPDKPQGMMMAPMPQMGYPMPQGQQPRMVQMMPAPPGAAGQPPQAGQQGQQMMMVPMPMMTPQQHQMMMQQQAQMQMTPQQQQMMMQQQHAQMQQQGRAMPFQPQQQMHQGQPPMFQPPY